MLKELLEQALFGAQAHNAVDCIWRTVRCGVKMPNLKLTEKSDADHLNAAKNQDSSYYEHRTMKIHDVLACNHLQDKQPDGNPGTGKDTERADGAKEVQWARHVLQQEPNCKEVEEDAECPRDAIMTFAGIARGIRDRNLTNTRSIPGSQRRDEAMHLSI